MALLDSLNDRSWAVLDWLWDRNIPIGRVFEKYNLPAVLFPLTIILLILVIIMLVAMPGGAPVCGDGTCAPEETCVGCPLDCGDCNATAPAEEGMIVTVQLIGTVNEPLTVTILDKDSNPLSGGTGRKKLFEFPGIEPQLVKATVGCPNGKEQTSRPRNVNADDSVINLAIPDDCFNYIRDDSNMPVETHGNIGVTAYDTSTGESIEATVSVVRDSDDITEESSVIDGTGTINAMAGRYYYLTATKTGYAGYNGEDNRFYLVGGDTVYRTIRLRPLPSAAGGSLEVCATSGQGPLDSGRITVNELGGSELDSASLSPSDSGCRTFSITPGKMVKATVVSLPEGCTSPGFSDSITVGEALQTIELEADCDTGPAFVKVKVQNRRGEVLTQNVTITLWNAEAGSQIPGSSPDASLSMGSGGYTEEVSVPSNTLIQAKAASAVLGYVDTASGPSPFSPGEHGSIDIILGEEGGSGFSFPGASIFYNPATPGLPIKVFVEEILYNQTVLTDLNSDVTVLIDGEEYEATYRGSDLL